MGLGVGCVLQVAQALLKLQNKYALESDKSKTFERVWQHGHVDLVAGEVGLSLVVFCRMHRLCSNYMLLESDKSKSSEMDI